MFTHCKECDFLKNFYGIIPLDDSFFVQKDFDAKDKWRVLFCPLVTSQDLSKKELKEYLSEEDFLKLSKFQRIKVMKSSLKKSFDDIKFFISKECVLYVENILHENVQERVKE